MSNFSLSGSSNKTCGRQGWKIQVRHQDHQDQGELYGAFIDAFIVQQGQIFLDKNTGPEMLKHR